MVRVLDVPIGYFFNEMDLEVEAQSPRQLRGAAPQLADLAADPATKRETLELVRVYYGIKNQEARHRFIGLVRAISRSGTPTGTVKDTPARRPTRLRRAGRGHA